MRIEIGRLGFGEKRREIYKERKRMTETQTRDEEKCEFFFLLPS